VRQAEQLVFNAAATISDLERQIRSRRTSYTSCSAGIPRTFRACLARTAGACSRGSGRAAVGAGSSGGRHPRGGTTADRRQREHRRRQSGLFSQISLTASGGLQSAALSDLFTKPAGLWSSARADTADLQPGRTRSRVALSKAQQEKRCWPISRRSSSRCAEVSDAPLGYRKGRDFREQAAAVEPCGRGCAAPGRHPLPRAAHELSRSAGQRHADVLGGDWSHQAETQRAAVPRAGVTER